MSLKHLSMFSGVGGFDLGLEMAGVQTIAQCENDKYARRVLRHHWPEVELHDDICELDGEQYRGVDVISGGFPCQGLSVAGRRKGLADARSGLFFQMCRVVAAARPRLILWENVPGLLSQDGRRAIVEVERTLADCGYYGAWRVINSQFAGVPQRRRRVFGAFAAGSAGGWACGAAVLLEPEGGGWSPAEGGEAGEDVARCLDGGSGGGGGGGGYRRSPEDTYIADVTGTLSPDAHPGGCNGQDAYSGQLVASCIRAADGHHGHGSPRGDGSDNLVTSPTPRAMGRSGGSFHEDHALVAYALRQDPGGVGNVHNTNYVVTDCDPLYYSHDYNQDRIYGVDGAIPAHTAQDSNRARNILYRRRVRRLTVTECERLQGFPPGWTDVDGMSDTQRYRQLGNAVSVPVAYWIGLRAKMALEATT